MPAAVASRPQKTSRASRDSAPPAKKAKLAESSTAARANGLKALVNGSAAQKPTAKINGVKNARSNRVDEATTVVGGGQAGLGDVDMEDADQEVIEISSSSEESDDESDDEAQDTQAGAPANDQAPAVNGHDEDDPRAGEDEAVDAEELSFGDRLRAQDSETARETRIVDVDAAFEGANADLTALTTSSQTRTLAVPSINTLGTVLTQALRTNDQDLFDSCLRNVDIDAIYATVERLPSPLVGTLLQRLAERMHKKPGRAGTLMVWVQWSLAAHGGYLASQPQLVKQLATLNKVLKERASGLQPLLSLKGRLDMLSSQLELRKRNQRRAADDDEEEAVIYVEGEDDYASSDDGFVEGDAPSGGLKRPRNESEDDDESSIDQMPTTMEVDDEDSDEGSDDSDDLLDDEAEETDLDTGDDMSEPMSDDLEGEEASSESEEDSKPARRSTATRAGLKSRH